MSRKIKPAINPELRRRAEKAALHIAASPPDATSVLMDAAVLPSIHELQVHQIELEMQNEELRQREAELDALRARYFQIYEQAPVGYLTVDKQGLILEANLTAASLLGVLRSDLIEQPFEHLVVQRDLDTYHLVHRQLFETGLPQSCEVQMRKRDGTHIWAILRSTTTRLEGESGRVCLMAISDITQRKQAEAGQRESEGLFRTMANSAPVLIWMADLDKGCFFLNKTWLEFTGRSLEQELGKGWTAGVHAADLDRCLATYQTNFDARREFAMDYRLRRSDGVFRWIHDKGIPRFDRDGRFLGYIGSCSDINDQIESELKHTIIAAWNKAMTDGANRAIISTTPEGLIQTINPAAERMLGYSAQELLGKPMPPALHDPVEVAEESRRLSSELDQEIPPGFETVVAKARRNLPSEHEWTFIRKDGSRFPALLSVSPIRGPDEGIIGFLVLAKDITERKRAEKERSDLQLQNEHLQRSHSLGLMAGAIAHHFNNQLQVVMMNLDFAMQVPGFDETLSESLAGAMQGALKAAEMSTMMLTYLGQSHGTLQLLDLSETCQRLLPVLSTSMPKKITLEVSLPAPGPTISANPSQIQQVMVNLLTNAWESTNGRPSTIRINSSTVPGSKIPSQNRFPIEHSPEDHDYACLEVADSGSGIPASDIHLIFDPFHSTKFTGRGLGLSVVLGIIRSNHGFVTVESEQARGSKFRVFIPIAAESLPLPVAPVVSHINEIGVGTLMVIDDDPALRELLVSAVEWMGFTVIEACDGVEAVELFRQHHEEIRLVISDLTMPRMDGWDTLQALRKISPGIPVILSSGHSENHVMSGDHAELPQAFLMKPYDLDRLRTTIFSILGTHEPARRV
jgi:PAS domain S-box-containing protein